MTEQRMTETDQPGTPAESCPNCGMAREDWRGDEGRGYEFGGVTYCCEGCAVGTGCTCVM